MAPTTRPLANPGIRPASKPLLRAQMAKKLGIPMAKKLGIPTRAIAKAMSSLTPSPSPNASLGCTLFSSYYYCTYDGVFDSGGLTWYYQVSYYYDYYGNYYFYGYNLWYYYFGWNYYGWFCCY
jgi:hypothetical protein